MNNNIWNKGGVGRQVINYWSTSSSIITLTPILLKVVRLQSGKVSDNKVLDHPINFDKQVTV